MSDKKEAFETDLGHVEVDLKKKTVTVDGKPLNEVTQDRSLMELLLRDLSIDREIMMALRSNVTALKTWLPGIGNREARETFRKFCEDTSKCIDAMGKQRELQIISLKRMEKSWQAQTAGTQNSTSDAPTPPSATDALETPKTETPLPTP
jgi:hypothetical protein